MRGPADHPVLLKEFNRRMREKNAFLVPVLYIVTLTLVFGSQYLDSTRMHGQPWEIGASLFQALSWLSLILVVALVPVFSAGSITIEKEQKTLSSLRMTLLAPSSIIVGKLGACVGYVLLVVSTSIPIILIPFLFGGISPGSLLLHYVSLTVMSVFLGCVGLLVSASFKRSMYAIAFNYGLLALTITVALFLISYLTRIEYMMKIPFLHYMAFFSPLFFLDDSTRNQWPAFVLFYVSFSALLSRAASVRLRGDKAI